MEDHRKLTFNLQEKDLVEYNLENRNLAKLRFRFREYEPEESDDYGKCFAGICLVFDEGEPKLIDKKKDM